MKKVLMLCAVVAFALSCTKSDKNSVELNGAALEVSCDFAGFDSFDNSEDSASPTGFDKSKNPTGSRLTDTAFEVEDEIGIYVHTDPAVQNPPSGNHSSNMRYIFKAGNTWLSASSLGGELTQSAYNATGYYPYKGTITNPHAVAHSVELDQSTHAAMSRSDFARAVGALDNSDKEAPTLDFSDASSFKHLMSKLCVKAAIPTEVDGVNVIGVESIVIGGLKNGCTVNLATGVVTLNTSAVVAEMIPNEITAGGAGSVGEWEAIVVPQSVAVGVDLVTITLNMVGGSTKELKYTIESGEAFDKLTSGTRVTLTLGNSSDLVFTEVSQLDLVDGLAKTGGKFSVKAPSGTTWSVASSSSSWLTLSNNSNITGTGSAQEVTFAIALNSTEKIRTATLTLSATINGRAESTTHTVTQNYYTMTTPSNPATATAGQQSIVVGAITSNQLWYLGASSTGNWLKLATSATYSASNPIRFPATAPDKHIGSLVSGQLFYQLDVNNSAAVRTSTVTFTPDDGTTTAKTVTQSAPVLTLDKTTQTVEAKTTSATFQVKSSSNQFGVTYTPTKGSNVTSIAPDVFQTVDIIGSYSKTITVVFPTNAGGSSDRTFVATITYGSTKTLTHTITQSADGADPTKEGVLVGNLYWAKGNLVADGISGAKCKVGAPTDYGLYFQFGGLVGWSGGNGTGAGTGSPAMTVKVKPTTMPATSAWNPNYTGQGSNINGYGLFNWSTAPYATAKQDIRGFNETVRGITGGGSGNLGTGKYASIGVGDPCTYYLGSKWRLPTTDEIGSIFSYNASWSWPSGWSWNSASAYKSSIPLRFPASGYRDLSNGSFNNVGSYGYCWSSSVGNSNYGYYLYFLSSGVISQNYNYRSNGFPVRCVSPS